MSYIAEQNWDMVSTYDSQEQNRDVRGHNANKIVEENRVLLLQKMEKDVIIPADPHGRQQTKTLLENATEQPPLPDPSKDWKAFLDGEKDQEGLISIIGAVLALQAKTNSNWWSNLWKQASQSMMANVDLAPVIGKAITTQYQKQSDSTLAESQMNMWEGIINLGAFGLTCVLGGISAFKKPGFDEPSAKSYDEEENTEGTGKSLTPGVAAETESSIQGTESDIAEAGEDSKEEVKDTAKKAKARDDLIKKQKQISDAITQKDPSFGDGKVKDVKEGMSNMQRFQKYFMSFLGHGMQAAAMTSTLSQGLTGLAVDSPYKAKKAQLSIEEGEQAALSKTAEMYAQFYQQDFGRTEDLRQGAQQQGIDNPMNILQQAANTITATVRSMFGG